ncbi:hypothetical protein Glove_374g31 [Diversispora epigaea]|uniref:Zinc-ribbon domain-containing protein n=1 Tax=Diversispora epigaea TaxID=1348612 RepID=A0A397H9L1_9GLOM|nr:hypothetical protein Glove_374g31 [Diversispora epigaea]
MLWECNKNHQWTAKFRHIKNQGSWCPDCSNRKPLNLEIAKQIAYDKNGECLSISYVNSREPLKWKCSKNHIWYTSLGNIKNQGTWCKICSQTQYSIEDCRKYAFKMNGECLSTEYENCYTKLLWSCTKNHKWYATFKNVNKRNTWCPYCVCNVQYTLEDVKQIAYSRNGKCLSTKYKNCYTKLLWSCAKNHKWYTTFNSVKNGNSWCPYCAGQAKNTLDIAKIIAFNKGGECISNKYINGKSHLRWKCVRGHEWNSSLASIKNGNTWCPYCSKYKRENLCREIVSKYLGEPSKNRKPDFLKTSKHPSGLELDIYYPHCAKNHKWYTTFNSVKNGNSWCPYCAGQAKNTLDIAKIIAFNKGGECISNKYINGKSHLRWKCVRGHEWNSSLASIKNGNTWCPYCSKYKRENLCREIVSKYLGEPSKNRKPDFLKTSKHPSGLELDIYYPQYGLAIEVQGQQHEKYIKFFHREDSNNFIKQQERDQLKNELCNENWIVLRYVWYYEDPYIVIPEHLRELGLIE